MTTQNPAEIIIVSGLPRSGTSMMMRMLEAGGIPPLIDNLRRPNEDNPGGYYEFEPVKRTKQDPSWLTSAGGKVVKMVYRLLYDLPAGYEYRVIMMRRTIEEVLASQEAMLKRDGRLDHVEDAAMAALFRAELAACDKWLAVQPNFAAIDIDYTTVVTQPAGPVAEIAEFLNLPLDQAAMRGIIDKSLYRNRKSSATPSY